MPSARTILEPTKCIELTASGAETQTLTADALADFDAAWPAGDGNRVTAVGLVRNTSSGTCTVLVRKAGDTTTSTPNRVLDPASVTADPSLGSSVLRLGPYTRETWAALQLVFSAAGTATIVFDVVVNEGGYQ